MTATQTATAMGRQTPVQYPVGNDTAGEYAPYSPQIAMAVSINTAYADLWRIVAGTAARTWLRWRRRSA